MKQIKQCYICKRILTDKKKDIWKDISINEFNKIIDIAENFEIFYDYCPSCNNKMRHYGYDLKKYGVPKCL